MTKISILKECCNQCGKPVLMFRQDAGIELEIDEERILVCKSCWIKLKPIENLINNRIDERVKIQINKNQEEFFQNREDY